MLNYLIYKIIYDWLIVEVIIRKLKKIYYSKMTTITFEKINTPT